MNHMKFLSTLISIIRAVIYLLGHDSLNNKSAITCCYSRPALHQLCQTYVCVYMYIYVNLQFVSWDRRNVFLPALYVIDSYCISLADIYYRCQLLAGWHTYTCCNIIIGP